MKKILHIVSSWGTGGVERYISNYINEMDEYIFDILTIRKCKKESVFTQPILDRGGEFFSLNQVEGNIFERTSSRKKELVKLINKNKYEIVHINAGTADAFILAHSVKKQLPNIKVVMHCHGSNVEAPKKILKRAFHEVFKFIYGNNVDYCIDVSDITLSWMFKKSTLKNKPYSVFSCGIDIEKFKYNKSDREKIRKELGIENEFVIGTIGRFTQQKNPFYIVKIISELNKLNDNFKFLWVGEGKLLDDVKEKAKELGIYEKFIFYGISKNIAPLLSTMDLFILPSCFEGNPIVGIEAQANGLKCIFSNTITREVDVTENSDFISIVNSEKIWAKKILECKVPHDRNLKNITSSIKSSGCDMKENSIKLSNIYNILTERK